MNCCRCRVRKTQTLVLSGFLIATLLVTNSRALWAQEKTSQVWQSIEKTESRIQNLRVQWEQKILRLPNSNLNPERHAERTMKLARQQGLSEAEVKERGRITRTSANSLRKGFAQYISIDAVRSGRVVRADIHQTQPLADTQKFEAKPNYSVHTLNFIDERNTVTVEGTGLSMPKDGLVRRDSTPALQHAIPGSLMPILLLSQSVDLPDGQAKPKLSEKNGLIVLDQPMKVDTSQGPIAFTLLLYLSPQHWRPVKAEVRNPFDNNALTTKIEVSGYKQYPGGIWYPSFVKATNLTAGKGAVKARVVSTDEFRLVKASFNDPAVDKILGKPLPAGTRLNDLRFSDPGVSYEVGSSGQLPSDQKVRQLMDARQAEQAAQSRTPVLAWRQLLLLSFGASLITAGIVLWRRNTAREA